MADRTHKEFSDADIVMLAETYHNWRKGNNYEDKKGFCKSATISDIQKHNYVLTPGRYVGITDAIDDGIPFEEKMTKLTVELKNQMAEEQRLNEEIKKQLAKVGIKI
jgi:type I restriction enzyme M protein